LALPDEFDKLCDVHEPSPLAMAIGLVDALGQDELKVANLHFVGLVFRDSGLKREKVFVGNPLGF
jgi:hypothetical protein